MGERQEQPFELSFNGRLKVDFQGSRVTSEGGLLLVRELDERLGFGALIERHLTGARGKNTQLPPTDLARQSVYSRLAGYEDVNDAERLSQDPAFRLIGSERVLERGAALTSRLQSFETELLTQGENLAGLARDQPRLDRQGAKRVQRALRVHLLSPPAVVQPRRRLPGGETAPRQLPQRRGLEELLLPEIERQQQRGKVVVFRADAAFAKPELYEALEQRQVKYVIRLPANDNLERKVAQLLKRPVGRASDQPVVRYRSFFYQAACCRGL